MKSICLFCSYYNSPNVPNYVQYYLKELTKHFSKVVFITNEKEVSKYSLSFLEAYKIEPFLVSNEGYDFGMWYKAILKYDVEQYDRVGLVNDSCILFKPLDDYFSWLNKQDLDYAGMIDSTEIIYHIQSYFLTINKNAIKPTVDFFKQHGLQANREEVIKLYELGLCKHLQDMGLKTGAWYSSEKYFSKYNSSVHSAHAIIKDGFPMIKKKIIFNSFSQQEYREIMHQSFKRNYYRIFKHHPNYYIKQIKRANEGTTLFDFNLLRADGYNPDVKKIYSLQFLSFYHHIYKTMYYSLQFVYRFLGLRALRHKLKP